MNKIVISVTGHRLLSSEQIERIRPVVKKAILDIMDHSSHQSGPVSFEALSPLAEGADTIFAITAKSLGLPLRVILPFGRSEYLKDFLTDDARVQFDALYDGIDDENKTVLARSESDDHNDLFMKLGRKIVDDADYILAIWNEKESKGKGGTGDVVVYGKEKRKHILIINPEQAHPSINFINP